MSNVEIVVVGAGVAGLSAALAVAGTGHDVTLVTKTELVESNTYHAQGGIAAAIFSDDDPKLHAADTMAAGHGLCDPKAVDILTREGADRVREFAAAGVHFDRDAQGHMLRGLEAAHSRARVVHAGGDATGKVLELDVSAMVRENPRIHIIEHAFLKDLIVRDGRIAGVRLLIDGQDKDLAADRVILATGGAGRMYPYTTNPQVATADGVAAAWRAGAQVADLEFYQFHPTAMAVGELFVPETNCAEVYYQFREEFNKSQDPFRRAVLFLYLNRYGYNGLCRYNLRGEFNVPFGRYKKPYFPEAELYHFAEKAQNAFFYCESYADSMARADDASVVYCDPPYAPLSATANFTAYHTNSFTLEQQAHLAEIAEGLVERHIPVLISNHDTMLTREWYQRAKLHVVKVRRSISSNGGTRKKVDELLALYKPGVVSPAKK